MPNYCVCMCTHGVLRIGQQPLSVVSGFITQGEYEVRNGHETAHCDRDQFCGKTMTTT